MTQVLVRISKTQKQGEGTDREDGTEEENRVEHCSWVELNRHRRGPVERRRKTTNMHHTQGVKAEEDSARRTQAEAGRLQKGYQEESKGLQEKKGSRRREPEPNRQGGKTSKKQKKRGGHAAWGCTG